jgi:hypothetical protein
MVILEMRLLGAIVVQDIPKKILVKDMITFTDTQKQLIIFLMLMKLEFHMQKPLKRDLNITLEMFAREKTSENKP